jgi:hypothetical protein
MIADIAVSLDGFVTGPPDAVTATHLTYDVSR